MLPVHRNHVTAGSIIHRSDIQTQSDLGLRPRTPYGVIAVGGSRSSGYRRLRFDEVPQGIPVDGVYRDIEEVVVETLGLCVLANHKGVGLSKGDDAITNLISIYTINVCNLR